jgi:hypothetical protein
VDGARVVAEVIEHLRGDKILVFKYKNKVRYRRRHGHRQDYTRLSIKEIVTASGSVSAGERPLRRRPEPTDAEDDTQAVEATTEAEARPRRRRAAPAEESAAEAEAPAAEASTEQPARRTRVRKAEPAAEGTSESEGEKPARRSRAPKAEEEGE